MEAGGKGRRWKSTWPAIRRRGPCSRNVLTALEFLEESLHQGEVVPAGKHELGGQPLGDFRILREVGRGGMGVVYEAEQMSWAGGWP